LTPRAIAYSWRELCVRAGLVSSGSPGGDVSDLPVALHYGDAPTDRSRPTVVVRRASDRSWRDLLGAAENCLEWRTSEELTPPGSGLAFENQVPILFWAEQCEVGQPFASLDSTDLLVFNADILAATFFMLTRWEETQVQASDLHGRFPAAASTAFRLGFLDLPVIDQYAMILREWLKALLPGWVPKCKRFEVKLSHDIDFVGTPTDLAGWTRRLGGDLIVRRDPRGAWRNAREAVWQWARPQRMLQRSGIAALASLSEQFGFESAFYFMATRPGPRESDYDVATRPLRRAIDELRGRGFEVGLHAGYHTFDDVERLATEKHRFDDVLGHADYGGRQHYLRFRAPTTWRHWDLVRLAYDSTVSYPDHEGFRCGTCHPFLPFDLDHDRELRLYEIPLIVMDGTLFAYRRLTPPEGASTIDLLARRCREVEGVFTLLWHNVSEDPEWSVHAPLYPTVLGALASLRG
jgi:hypothetical protein